MFRENDLWYKHAVIYALDVETFQDSDGSGTGDFRGVIERLDYLATLGINCVWLLPFYPSPSRDNGYDVKDYYNVDPRLGTLGDFAIFIREARERGIRVLIDLVVNHTSDEHPWFQEARRDENSPYRDYYIWRKEKPEQSHAEPVFKGVHDDIWNYDEVADAYFLHRFYHHQPDLNIASPAVRQEIHNIMGFWLALGVGGFRVDSAHILVQNNELRQQGIEDPEDFYDLLEDMREYIETHSENAVLVGEVFAPPQELRHFFKENRRMQLMFNFTLNQYLFLAMAREDAQTMRDALRMLPETPPQVQWINFLRHHDELSLVDLSQSQREEIAAAFAPEEEMWVYDRGVRRRLAPMLQGDRQRIELAYSLCFSLPGTPLIQYGAEIGMGEDLTLPERKAIRTSMQWADAHNAGFSPADSSALPRPVIADGPFSYRRCNVATQQRESGSLLNWIERLIRVRRQCPEIGCGDWKILETGNRQVLAHRFDTRQATLLAVHHLGGKQPCRIVLEELVPDQGTLTEVLSDQFYDPPSGDPPQIALDPFGYRWFRISMKMRSA